MLELPKISIITPSLNQADFIEETIRSVLTQNYPNLEYFVVDGGSTDGTIDILQKYNKSIIWTSEKDRGQSHAINKGLAVATGDLIGILNSDDVYEPDTLRTVGGFFIRHPQSYWLTGWCRTVDIFGKEIRTLSTIYKRFWLLFKSYKTLLVLDYVSQPATFWHSEVIRKTGNFDENLHYAMDYDYSLRVGKYFKLYVIPQYLARYRIHSSSKAGASTNAQFDTDFQIASSHTNSKILRKLHAWHNALLVRIYRELYHSI